MRLPLLRGRDFDDGDVLGRPGVIIVNEALAEAHWPGQDPLGRSMTLDDPTADDVEWLTVVGVARNAVRSDWSAAPEAEMYLPYLQSVEYLEASGGPFEYLTLVARTAGDPIELIPAARSVVHSSAPDVAVTEIETMEAVASDALAEPRLYLILLTGFASLALLLAAIGIYGVVSYSVSQRRQELAIRMALGARPGDVLALVVGQGMGTVLLGSTLGLLGALTLGRTLSSLLYGVQASDPFTLACVVLLLGHVALLATYVPARRAVDILPLAALRED
jgi:putative ABC transport system permease protein